MSSRAPCAPGSASSSVASAAASPGARWGCAGPTSAPSDLPSATGTHRRSFTMDVIEERVTGILSGQFKLKKEIITPEVTFQNLSFDSLVLIELSLVLEKEFQVVIEEGDLTDQLTVRELAELLTDKGAVA
ncbi:putative phosphopantetheine attachment site [Streptomyces himastatinicus ATCC 53653]|nr:putative phosphopantetheine attachment site [Streptomyces himastatinicus ATCC 53653]